MKTYQVIDRWEREQDDPLNGWNSLDGGISFEYGATDGWHALQQWAGVSTHPRDWLGDELEDATGYSYDRQDADAIIDEVDEHGLVATINRTDAPRTRVVIKVAELETD